MNQINKVKATIDLNGGFLYIPKQIMLGGENVEFTVTNGYIITEDNIKKAVKELRSEVYRDWLSNYDIIDKIHSIN